MIGFQLHDKKLFNHYTNLLKADTYLCIRYSIYISMLQFQLYDGVKYFFRQLYV